MGLMKRRDFLKSIGIIAAAPAIVQAENIMKIWVPPTDIIQTVFEKNGIVFDTITQEIKFVNKGQSVNVSDLYKAAKQIWYLNEDARKFHYPLDMQTMDTGSIKNGWNIDPSCVRMLRNGAINYTENGEFKKYSRWH